jgi:hypothetical protein
MNYPIIAYGHDFGNSETCGVMLAPGQRVEGRKKTWNTSSAWSPSS